MRPGTHINAVGADTKGKRELPEGLLRRSTLVTDDRLQSQTVGEGQWAPGLVATEIGELLGDTAVWTRAPDAVTVFDMTGLALQDLTVAGAVAAAAAQERGHRIPWPC